jgi:hypothetical protein
VDRDEKPVELSLDRKNYRIPLSWRTQIVSGERSRFALSLSAQKASHHLLRLNLVLADGHAVSSRPMDISYFKPRMPAPPPDDPRDKN